LHRIQEYAFAESNLRTIQISASVEVFGKHSLFKCKALTSVTFEVYSKLREVGADCVERSLRLHPIEYPSSLSEESRKVISHVVGVPSSSITEEE
jgi:hypothetical protein